MRSVFSNRLRAVSYFSLQSYSTRNPLECNICVCNRSGWYENCMDFKVKADCKPFISWKITISLRQVLGSKDHKSNSDRLATDSCSRVFVESTLSRRSFERSPGKKPNNFTNFGNISISTGKFWKYHGRRTEQISLLRRNSKSKIND